MTTNKVAIYVRVSLDATKEEKQFQDPDNQLFPLRDMAKAKGWDTVEFIEKAHGGSNRPVFHRMFGRAMMMEFKGILFYSLDRFSREGILDTLSYFKRLKERGVWVKSLKEEWMDTDSPFTELMLAQFAWFAQFERKKISDRTKAGLARKKRMGVILGRPRICLTCGWSHKVGKQCKQPYRPIKGPPNSTAEKTDGVLTGIKNG
jgi:DNA invertase Pin-like site-specific DNA recombinase